MGSKLVDLKARMREQAGRGPRRQAADSEPVTSVKKVESNRKRKALKSKLMASVEKSRTCWLWTAGVGSHGYGQIYEQRGKPLTVHRVSYELFKGRIPDGLYVLHSCDNKRCVRPSHLHLGTHADNMKEASERGLSASGERNGARLYPERISLGLKRMFKLHPEKIHRGEDHPLAVLCERDVMAIRRSARNGLSIREIASRYAVGRTQILRIVRRERWKHVP